MSRILPSESSRLKDIARLNRSGIGRVAALMMLSTCAHFPSQPRSGADYWGFTGPWDRRSDVSVERHGSSLARIITGWIALDTISFLPVQLYPDNIGKTPALASRAMALITSHN